MANNIGKVLSGAVLALCMVLLTTPQASAQTRGRQVMLTIAGSVGIPGVTMQGLPGTQTDENGVYTAQVAYGFTGTVTPVKSGYTFDPANKKYAALKENKTEEKYIATAVMCKISGSVTLPGVVMRGLPGDPCSGPDGHYSVTVPFGFTAVVAPEKPGYRFEPESKAYAPVTTDQTQDYRPIGITYTISGTVSCSLGDANGVVLQGLPGDPRTGPDGAYHVAVPYNWSGKVKPQREGCTFTPPLMEYPPVTADMPNQDYMGTVLEFTISGTAGQGGATLQGLPDNPVSDANGSYSAKVPYGYTGKIQPTLKGYTFAPQSISIPKMTVDRKADFTATIMHLTISGTIQSTGGANVAGVTMDGLPNTVTDVKGFYTAKVDFGFSGTVTPTKEGLTFSDAAKPYSSIETDQLNQNYKASPVLYTLSGNVQEPNVTLTLTGVPKMVKSEAGGAYTVDVPWHWTGTITPRMSGFQFDPPSAKCEPMVAAKTQDFTAKPILFEIGGKVLSQDGAPVIGADVSIDPGNLMITTDDKGEYRVSVRYGWMGKIQVAKNSVTFTKNVRDIQVPVTKNMLDQNFTGQVKMLTITNVVSADDAGTQPIEGVIVKAIPGNFTAASDAKGKYTVRVPFGWTGDLQATKEGWNFDPIKFEAPVQESIDMTPGAKPPVNTTKPPTDTTKPPTDTAKPPTGTTKPPTDTTKPPTNTIKPPIDGTQRPPQAEPERAALIEKLRALLGRLPTDPEIAAFAQESTTPPPGMTLLDVLDSISRRTGTKVISDATVKPVAIPAVNITGLPATTALEKVLGSITGTPYKYKQQDKDTYLVYRSISTTLAGDLVQELANLASLADVPIMTDENVVGKVSATLTDLTLDQALDMILAPTGFVSKRMPGNYYVVTSGLPKHGAFVTVSVTEHVNLEWQTPARVVELLSGAWTDYVKASSDPNGHTITVTAPRQVADRIIADIRAIDFRPRQVLLTARVVSMERGNMFDVGVEWGMPKLRAGAFSDSFVRGTPATGEAIPAGGTPWGVQIGYSPDRTFTDSLLMSLNLLHENGQADIVANPQVMAVDGKPSRIANVQEQWFMLTAATNNSTVYTQAEMQKIESGTILTITPKIGDNNDIQLEMAVEVSDSIPNAVGTGLPVVTRRQAKNFVIIPDGGTAAVSGLTENKTKTDEKRVPFFSDLPLVGGLFRNNNQTKETREIAIFVTANIAAESTQVAFPALDQPVSQASAASAAPAPASSGGSFRDELKQGVAN